MNRISYSAARWIMILLVVIETRSGAYFTNEKLEFLPINSIAYFLSGILIALFPLFCFQSSPNFWKSKRSQALQKIAIVVFFLWTIWCSIPPIYWIFQEYAIDYHNADMIPQIIVACNRWLAGEYVYAPIPEIWNGLIPTYLPLMWIPFAPAILLQADVRWTTVIFYFIAVGILLWMLTRSAKVNWIQLLLILTLIGNLIFIQTDYNRIFFAWTQEGIVVAYYVLLGFALAKKNPWLIGVSISCCLLSRYALFFWIPAYIVYQFASGEKKKPIIECLIIAILVFAIFVIPYFLKDPKYFISLPEKYSEICKRSWYQGSTKNALGLAKFFTIEQYQLLVRLQLIFSVMIPVSFFGVVLLLRKRMLFNQEFIALSGLKLTLVFFYNFIEGPGFFYLFMVPTFFSYAILLHFLNPESQKCGSRSKSTGDENTFLRQQG